jgi:hypothetical protein
VSATSSSITPPTAAVLGDDPRLPAVPRVLVQYGPSRTAPLKKKKTNRWLTLSGPDAYYRPAFCVCLGTVTAPLFLLPPLLYAELFLVLQGNVNQHSNP